ncbi:MAG TPA: hypothetical protein VER76_10940 [Pyrinomonadaceae bacterium]|nr:hypothetical protein [Pyrinomonadaceae bacterium]
MFEWQATRTARLREFFDLGANRELIGADAAKFEPLPTEMAEGLAHFQIEWHVIPSAEAVALDDAYLARLYPSVARDFTKMREHGHSYRDQLLNGHKKHQGRIVGVETTRKPRYLPGNRQFYGTAYGHDPTADPLAPYMGRAGMMNGTRYAHNYLSLRTFITVVNEDWRARNILPAGYRVTVCPPAVFNLVGTIFHPEWSETETLELGFYRDAQGNATCFAVGSHAPGDFSHISEIEGEGDWSLAGFRLALVPDE